MKTVYQNAVVRIRTILWMIMMAVVCGACADFLDAKPDQTLAVPTKLKDMQALLDEEGGVNANYPDVGDVSSDYYYLTDADWSARPEDVRQAYIWNAQPISDPAWEFTYAKVFLANVVLESVDDATLGGMTEIDRNRIKGTAFFIRGFAHLHLAQLYAPQYIREDAEGKLGIPLKMKSDITDKTIRASLEETYTQILADFKAAVELLPVNVTSPTRPNRPAAFGALARTYLIMSDYESASRYADSCLALHPILLDYGTLESSAASPIPQLCEEILFYADLSAASGAFIQSRARVADWVYGLYQDADLRKAVFFHENNDGSYSFKGSYGRSNSLLFCGLATDEIYLIAAEAYARLGNLDKAKAYLNELVKTRFEAGKLPVYSADHNLLDIIISERYRELAFRGGVAWSDLRRLNLEERFAREVSRAIDGRVFTLPPNDLRYTLLIPQDVIVKTGIEQNTR